MIRKTVFCIILIASQALTAVEADSTSLTRRGEAVPGFSITTLDGQQLNIQDLRGKVLWLNFFATWCPPCKAEMPELEKEVWRKHHDDKFILIAVGREHSSEELRVFREEQGYTFPIAADPNREIFSLFATANIPRNYIIDREGKIAVQSMGYTADEFRELLHALDRLLKE